jgi:hypothetical protein
LSTCYSSSNHRYLLEIYSIINSLGKDPAVSSPQLDSKFIFHFLPKLFFQGLITALAILVLKVFLVFLGTFLKRYLQLLLTLAFSAPQALVINLLPSNYFTLEAPSPDRHLCFSQLEGFSLHHLVFLRVSSCQLLNHSFKFPLLHLY